MPDTSALWEKLIHLVGEIESELAAVLQSRHGLGLTEYRALGALSTAPNDELRLQELAAQIRLNQSSVTRMVERLERRELAFRDPCPADKRGVYAVLTEKGRATLRSAEADYRAALTAAIARNDAAGLLTAALTGATGQQSPSAAQEAAESRAGGVARKPSSSTI